MPKILRIENIESNNNKVAELTSSVTNTQYPSAKAVYDALQELGGSTPATELVGKKTPEGGEIFNDYTSNIAGSKAFQVIEVVASTSNEDGTYTSGTIKLDSVEGLQTASDNPETVRDKWECSLYYKTNWDFFGKIIAIDTETNTITLDYVPDVSEYTDSLKDTPLLWVPAHPEVGTTEFGVYAHAEGTNNIASGFASHADGANNIAGGKYSHASGKDNIVGWAGSVSGYWNDSRGLYTFTAGAENINTAKYGNATGRKNTVTGFAAVASGNDNTASGSKSFVAGESNIASGDGSFALGYKNKSLGQNSQTRGMTCQATGKASTAEGYGSKATAEGAHAINYSTASGKYSHSAGYGTIAGYDYQTVIGKFNSNQPDSVFEIGWGNGNTSKNLLAVTTSGVVKVNNGNNYLVNNNELETQISAVKESIPGEKLTNKGTIFNKYVEKGVLYTDAAKYGLSSAYSKANGQYSTALGWSITNGMYSFAAGKNVQANAEGQCVVGLFNDPASTANFVVGNGTYNKVSNAFEVFSDGHAELQKQGEEVNSVVIKSGLNKFVHTYKRTIMKNVKSGSLDGFVFEEGKGRYYLEFQVTTPHTEDYYRAELLPTEEGLWCGSINTLYGYLGIHRVFDSVTGESNHVIVIPRIDTTEHTEVQATFANIVLYSLV